MPTHKRELYIQLNICTLVRKNKLLNTKFWVTLLIIWKAISYFSVDKRIHEEIRGSMSIKILVESK